MPHGTFDLNPLNPRNPKGPEPYKEPRQAGDQRISMVPDVAEQLIKDGYGVLASAIRFCRAL